MIQFANSEQGLFAEVLEREFSNSMQMLREFPPDRLDDRPRDCEKSARDLAIGFLERERTIHHVLRGRPTDRVAPPSSLMEIVGNYEQAHRETRETLASLTTEDWGESIRGPVGLGMWDRARRGELLWLALKELIAQDSHFAVHLRLAREDEALTSEA
jgi:hypothetical protein